MTLLNATELTWPEQIAVDDFKIFEGRVPCEGVARAEQWLEKKRSEFIAHIMHINEQASYVAFLARLIKETPSPAARAAELVPHQ
jgi:putative IMPACT (imprinted ancient) family translation regulator